eukprot:CAMPEP_0206124412 /NCGR_PEP_ID=MMETSP1472-20131121/12129_1 /ASSEMBLY_ACC=CAM_ASM_001108 /TAXON_ID=41880 /ORGANISM="Pycnococcus provasolii, Strain RCC251" /LENGTH=266 /DNA_ID=CAMNT_0053515187 /DNA_START=85 /DNA_END=885 /DNA_ORIENTATION=+
MAAREYNNDDGCDTALIYVDTKLHNTSFFRYIISFSHGARIVASQEALRATFRAQNAAKSAVGHVTLKGRDGRRSLTVLDADARQTIAAITSADAKATRLLPIGAASASSQSAAHASLDRSHASPSGAARFSITRRRALLVRSNDSPPSRSSSVSADVTNDPIGGGFALSSSTSAPAVVSVFRDVHAHTVLTEHLRKSTATRDASAYPSLESTSTCRTSKTCAGAPLRGRSDRTPGVALMAPTLTPTWPPSSLAGEKVSADAAALL